MSYPIYYVPAGDVLPILFSTYDGGTGASLTMTGLAVTDIEVYKDGGTTQRASDAGYTLLDTDGIDFDGITGIHGFSIDTGDNTDAGFYTVGAWFHVVVSAVTVDAQTVSFIAAAFRLMPAESIAGKPKVDVDAWLGTAAATPTTAGVPEVDVTHFGGSAGTFASGVPAVNTTQLSGDSTAADNAEAFFDGTGYAGTNNVIPTVTNLTNKGDGSGFTAIPWNASWDAEVQSEVEDGLVVHRLDELLNADSDIDGAAPPTVGSVFHELMSKTTGSFTFDQTTDSLEAVRDHIGDGTSLTEAGGTGDHLSAIPWNAAWDAEVQSEVTDALNAYDPPTRAELTTDIGTVTTAISGLNDLSAAEVNAEVVDALNTDTYAEPGQGSPGATITLAAKIGYLYKAWRNRSTQTASEYALYADDGTTKDQEAAVSDNGTTLDRGEVTTGA